MHYFYTLISLFFFSTSVTLYAGSSDSLRAETYFAQAEALSGNNECEKAIVWYKKAIKLMEEVLGEEHIRVGKSYNNLGNCFDDLGDYSRAIENLQKGLDIKLCSVGLQENTTSISYLNLGVAYRHKGYLDEALKLYEKALEIRKNIFGDEHYKIAYVYENMAICYEEKRDYAKAYTYYEKAIPIQQEELGEYDIDIGYSYNNIGGCLADLHKFTEALDYFNKALEILDHQEANIWDEFEADIYNNIGNCYQTNKQYEEALKMQKKSLVIRQNALPAHHPKIGDSFSSLADCYSEMDDYENALIYYKRFLELILAQDTPSAIDLADGYVQAGRIYGELGEFSTALSFQEKARKAFFAEMPTLSSETTVTQQQFDYQTTMTFNAPLTYYAILSTKAHILWQAYQKTKAPSYLFPALLSYRQTIDFIDQLRFSYAESQSKQFLLDDVYSDYEQAIAVCYELYQKKKNTRFLQEAFLFSEKSKSVLLLEAVNTTKAEDFAGIPDSLLQKEKKLQTDIAAVEQEKFLALQEDKAVNRAEIIALNQQLFDLKQKHETLIAAFETNYSAYFDLKYDGSTTSLETVQGLLQPEQTMIAYFLGDSSLFAFVLQNTAVDFFQLEKNIPINDLVQDVLTGLYNHQLDKHLNQQYVIAAHELYEKIWQPIIPPTAKDIIIIPNAELGVLPFEVLLKNYPSDLNYYSTYDYLIKDYQISYNYSATLFEKLSTIETRSEEHCLLAFAPSFEGLTQPKKIALNSELQRSFNNLKYTKKEVKTIQRILKLEEKVFLGKAATKANFLAHAGDCTLLHLATHGKVNNEFGDYSYLAFANTTTKNRLEHQLFVKDLYNLSLKADMVVLSACETGVGALKKGEGIVSLARGFFYAGAKSLVTTLWKVSDKSSSKIMNYFYKNLKKNIPKDAALRQAKLSYIQNHPDKLAHPFYWAAYIPVGNMQALGLDSSPSFTLYIILGIGFLLIFMMFYLRFRKI